MDLLFAGPPRSEQIIKYGHVMPNVRFELARTENGTQRLGEWLSRDRLLLAELPIDGYAQPNLPSYIQSLNRQQDKFDSPER
ncbi:hypothetical protein D3C84_795840 [compost metagenome]